MQTPQPNSGVRLGERARQADAVPAVLVDLARQIVTVSAPRPKMTAMSKAGG
jgi:hypothetical protein